MVGTVKQLQLGVEEDILSQAQKTGENLVRRMVSLSPSMCWSEAEETSAGVLDGFLDGSVL
jgi:hypothetical protein